MKHKKFVVITYVLISAIVFMVAPDLVKADSNDAYLNLSGPDDADSITLISTKDINLYSYRPSDSDEFFKCSVELSDYEGSIAATHTESYHNSYTFMKVDYTYVVSDCEGSTYFDSLKQFDYVTGPYFTVTCIATVSVCSSPSAPEDYNDRITVQLLYDPVLESCSATNSTVRENYNMLTGISEDVSYLVDNLGGEYEVSTEITNTGNAADSAVGDMSESEQKYFDQLDAAYDSAGIEDFKLSSMSGEFYFVQSIANLLWKNMPEALQYLFYAVMTIGVFALVVNSSRILGRMKD